MHTNPSEEHGRNSEGGFAFKSILNIILIFKNKHKSLFFYSMNHRVKLNKIFSASGAISYLTPPAKKIPNVGGEGDVPL